MSRYDDLSYQLICAWDGIDLNNDVLEFPRRRGEDEWEETVCAAVCAWTDMTPAQWRDLGLPAQRIPWLEAALRQHGLTSTAAGDSSGGEPPESHPHEDPIRGFVYAHEGLKNRLRSFGWEPGRPLPPHFTRGVVAEAWESFEREVDSIAARHFAAGPWVRGPELTARGRGVALISEVYGALADLDAIRRIVERLWQHAREIGGQDNPPPDLRVINKVQDALSAVADLLAWARTIRDQGGAIRDEEGRLVCLNCGEPLEEEEGSRLCARCCREGRLMDLWVTFKTSPNALDRFEEWPHIQHFACVLFGHTSFDDKTMDRLTAWMKAEYGIKSPLGVQINRVVTILREAVTGERQRHNDSADLATATTTTHALGEAVPPVQSREPIRDQGEGGQVQGSGEPGTSSTPAPVEEFVFAPSGNGYFIKGFGEAGHISEYKGLGVIARLLQTPEKPVPMQDLIGADDRMKADRQSPQVIFDAEAMKKIKDELHELEADLERARKENNTVAADLAQEDIEKLKQQVRQAKGLGGKDRDLNNLFDKLRSRIHGRLKSVYAALREASPPMPLLAEHFELSISSEGGNSFIYRPHASPPSWYFGEK